MTRLLMKQLSIVLCIINMKWKVRKVACHIKNMYIHLPNIQFGWEKIDPLNPFSICCFTGTENSENSISEMTCDLAQSPLFLAIKRSGDYDEKFWIRNYKWALFRMTPFKHILMSQHVSGHRQCLEVQSKRGKRENFFFFFNWSKYMKPAVKQHQTCTYHRMYQQHIDVNVHPDV